MKLVMELGGFEVLNGVVESGFGFVIVLCVLVIKVKCFGDFVMVLFKLCLMCILYMVYLKEKFCLCLVIIFVEFVVKCMCENVVKLVWD